MSRSHGRPITLLTLFSIYHLFRINPTQARLKAEHEYLLLVSRTRTDEQCRRHSVAVPVIPPPPGVKFEGGYHIEKNPITGAARLVPPPQGDSKAKGQNFVKNIQNYLSKI